MLILDKLHLLPVVAPYLKVYSLNKYIHNIKLVFTKEVGIAPETITLRFVATFHFNESARRHLKK